MVWSGSSLGSSLSMNRRWLSQTSEFFLPPASLPSFPGWVKWYYLFFEAKNLGVTCLSFFHLSVRLSVRSSVYLDCCIGVMGTLVGWAYFCYCHSGIKPLLDFLTHLSFHLLLVPSLPRRRGELTLLWIRPYYLQVKPANHFLPWIELVPPLCGLSVVHDLNRPVSTALLVY